MTRGRAMRHRVIVRAAHIGAALMLGVAVGCDEDMTGPPPPCRVEVYLIPTAISVAVGDSATVMARIQETCRGTRTAVNWRVVPAHAAALQPRSDSTVRVIGAAPGTAVLIATSRADSTARAAAQLTVTGQPAAATGAGAALRR